MSKQCRAFDLWPYNPETQHAQLCAFKETCGLELVIVVPVIDIKEGCAVRAIAGLRARYRPVRTTLCDGCKPADLLAAYLQLYPFPIIYLADLDAITCQGDNRVLIDTLTADFEEPTFWLDAGFAVPDHLLGYRHRERLRPVLASESLASVKAYRHLRAACRSEPVLSLDFKDGSFLGPPALLRRPDLWPEVVIHMVLDRVGGGRGPSPAVRPFAERAPTQRVFAAGGVRDEADLRLLETLGYHGALVASALLDGRLGSAELASIQGTS